MDETVGRRDTRYFAEAIREFDAALSEYPGYSLARTNRGIAKHYSGRREEGKADLEAVLQADPRSPHAHYVLGLIAEIAGDFSQAREHMLAVARVDPRDRHVVYHLGYCALRLEDYPVAVTHLRRAVEAEPYNRGFHYQLFQALHRSGQKAQAEVELARLERISEAGINISELPRSIFEYLKQGRFSEAVADSRRTHPPVPLPVQYSAVTRDSGLTFRHAGPGLTEEIKRVMQGKPTPSAWFEDPAHLRSLVAAHGSGACVCDYNNDGRLDLFLVNTNGRHALYVQRKGGRFEDVTREVGVLTRPELGMACAWGDYDNDGFADLLVTGYGDLRLYRNARGKLVDVTETTGIETSLDRDSWYMGAAFADVDHDGDLDLYVCRFVDVHLLPDATHAVFPNVKYEAGGGAASPLAPNAAEGTLRFPRDFLGRGNLLFRNNRNGTFTEIGLQAGADRRFHQSRGVRFSDVNRDRAVDFVLIDAWGAETTFLNRKDGTFARSPREVPRQPRHEALEQAAISFGDVNGDGIPDRLVNRNGDFVRQELGRVQQDKWLTVRLQGYVEQGRNKSNRMALGSTVELRCVGRWERKELACGHGGLGSDAPEIHFRLRPDEKPDFVRVTFPSGVRKTIRTPQPGGKLIIREPLLDTNSCPTLFAWNGRRFEYLTDTISAGILGELVAPRQYWSPDPDEWVRITDNQLVAKKRSGGDNDTDLQLRFVNPLEEVTYLDRVRLMAIDHPAEVEIHPNERMVNEARNREPAYAYAIRDLRPVRRATDRHGRDVTGKLQSIDRRYFDDYSLLPFKGFAEDWTLTVDLGDPGQQPVLLLHSWSYWNSSASVIAADQAGKHLWGPVLEVKDEATGAWRPGLDDMGVSAGLPRTIVVDLREILRTGEHTVRIRSNRTLYYDQIRLGQVVGRIGLNGGEGETRSAPEWGAKLTCRELPLQAARLRWLGYPRRILPDGKLPEVYDYEVIEPESEWGTHAGGLTRYGDVRPLLTQRDDRFVIMEHGEEIALTFAGVPSPTGRKRTYLFYSDGYEKGYEIHSGASETVDPLPYHGMKTYPYPPETRRLTIGFLEYLMEWNTR